MLPQPNDKIFCHVSPSNVEEQSHTAHQSQLQLLLAPLLLMTSLAMSPTFKKRPTLR